MDLTGLVDSIYDAVININFGRKGFAIIGKEREGRVAYETNIAKAMTAFKEAQTTADPQTIILAEYTFLSQELQFCELCVQEHNSHYVLNIIMCSKYSS